jgi:hypothetical protein
MAFRRLSTIGGLCIALCLQTALQDANRNCVFNFNNFLCHVVSLNAFGRLSPPSTLFYAATWLCTTNSFPAARWSNHLGHSRESIAAGSHLPKIKISKMERCLPLQTASTLLAVSRSRLMPEQPRDRPALDSATELSGFPDAVAGRSFSSNQIQPRSGIATPSESQRVGKEQMAWVQMPGENSVRAKS